jgi:preprotein translocase subunit SecF
MLIYYKLSGVNAVVALVLNLVILLGLMAYIGAVMTLPGIAGFVLTMGIGVDSNVLIFERIKEELEAQHGVRASINAGFSRVLWTLIDTHLAALISAGFLFLAVHLAMFGGGMNSNWDALRVVLEMGKASTSTLQRRLRLGYGRAARILDMMHRDGIEKVFTFDRDFAAEGFTAVPETKHR